MSTSQIEAREAVEAAIDLIGQLINGHRLNHVHGVPTRKLLAVRDDLQTALDEGVLCTQPKLGQGQKR